MPFCNAVWLLRWIVSPSAIGSENGMPTSIRSVPRAASVRMISAVSPRFGYPVVKYTDRIPVGFVWKR